MGETNRNQRTADGEACLISAEQIQRKLMAIRRKVDRLQDLTVGPNNPLPVDAFCRISTYGRSSDYQKIVFANEIAKLWKKLTGRPSAKGPDSNFGQFVVACWKSGFVDVDVNSSFKRILRDHIGS